MNFHRFYSKLPSTCLTWNRYLKGNCIPLHRCRFYSDENNSNNFNQTTQVQNLQGIASRYKIFQDYDSPVILDVDEERQLLRENPEALEESYREKPNPYEGYNLEKSETGIFDIEELVEILRKEHAQDIITIGIPPEFQYADYMVIVTGKSLKHIDALANFIRGLYKRKCGNTEKITDIEGQLSEDWKALDLGNIVLHIFKRSVRQNYNIELLWSVGPQYDDHCNQKDDEYVQLLKEHTHPALENLQPNITVTSQKQA